MSYLLRTAASADADAARSVMLDTVYDDLRSGYVPRWHRDIIDIEGTYLRPARRTLLVAVDEASGALLRRRRDELLLRQGEGRGGAI